MDPTFQRRNYQTSSSSQSPSNACPGLSQILIQNTPPQPNLQNQKCENKMMTITHQKSARADEVPRQNGNNQGIFLDNQVVNVGGQAQNPPQAAVQAGQNVPNQNQNPGQQGGAPAQHPVPA